ncbi:MAG: 2-oxoacid:acceptor oxidoreductase family protein [Candidatus Omnitrophota bacterium]
MMREIRIHARAGQGAITTAVILGEAFFIEGKFAFAFPHFGAARMGAPMNAFVRIDDKPIRLRSQIYEPDYLVIVDPTLMRGFNCFAGLKDDGAAVVNLENDTVLPVSKKTQKVFGVPANEIALKTIGRPLGNTALLGAFAAATKEIKLESLFEAINKKFNSKIADLNIKAAQAGYDYILGGK